MNITRNGFEYNKVYSIHHNSFLGKAWEKAELGFPKDRLSLTKDDIRNKEVLELGCGRCNSLRYYKQFNPKRLVGIDASNIVENIKIEGIELKRQDIMDLKFKDESFDVVYSTGVLHHVKDMDKGLEEASRVLKKGGILNICVYNPKYHPKSLPYWRKFTKKLPFWIVAGMSLPLVLLSYSAKYVKPLAMLNYLLPISIYEQNSFNYVWSCITDDLTVKYIHYTTLTTLLAKLRQFNEWDILDITFPENTLKLRKK